MNAQKIQTFQQTIWYFYRNYKRNLEWRANITPYRVLVSEIMLQQTQVARVTIKFPEFLKAFPDFVSLAKAANTKLLKVWQGMGYNRRALYLKKIAQIVVEKYEGKLPQDPEILETFPGIGHATARSIVCFAWNKPVVFIETNIRRVYIHYFFKDNTIIADKEIMPIIEKTLDKDNPREWYFALMDYGSYLGKYIVNPNRKSAHYIKQSVFVGSDRKVRGEILRILIHKKSVSMGEIEKALDIEHERFQRIMYTLQKEGFIKINKSHISIV